MKYEEYFGKRTKITQEESKELQYEILKYVDSYCSAYGLRYFISDGTLLGAIRHKGFIPWDDDIDIRMPRPDFLRMIDTFNEYAKDTHYRLIDPKEKQAKHFYIKIIDTRTIKVEKGLRNGEDLLGIDIDVIPLDGCPDDELAYLRWADNLRGYNKAYMYKKKTLLRNIGGRCKDIFQKRVHGKILLGKNCSEIMSIIYSITAQFPYDDSKYICAAGIVDRFRVPRECFEDYVLVSFEGSLFRAPIGYDEVLKTQYGDYMKLPPIEKQVTHHSNTVFWKNNSFSTEENRQ